MIYVAGPALLASFSVAVCAQRAPVAVLAEPGVEGYFLMLADGSVRARADGPVISEAIEPAFERKAQTQTATLSWYAPGSRVVRARYAGAGCELEALSGAAAHGRAGRQRLWLFRHLSLTNKSRQRAELKLLVLVSRTGATLKDDLTLASAEGLLLAMSRRPAEVREESGRTVLVFNFALPASGADSVLLAAPIPTAPDETLDVPDVRRQEPRSVLDAIAERWEGRLLSDRLRLGSASVTEAFYAALGTLLIFRPGAENHTELASTLSALSRAGQGTALSREVEALIAGQGQDGRFARVGDPALQADLTTALADYALYSDPPERWTSVLWRPIARAAEVLTNAAAEPATAARVALALTRAADVAGAVGQLSRAQEFRAHGRRLLTGPVPPGGSIFDVRSQALVLSATGTRAETTPSDAPLCDALGRAYLAVRAGEAETARRAWQTVAARLSEQPLPNVPVVDAREDVHCAAQLVFLVADSVTRAEQDGLRLLPATPVEWVTEGEGLHLSEFPSGLGPMELDATASNEGSISLSLRKTPYLAEHLLVSAPLGMVVRGVRANGKALSPEVFAEGPPWRLDKSVWSIGLLQGVRE